LAVTVAVGSAALVLLGKHRAPARTPAVAGRQQLINILGVLRRPQTPADLSSRAIQQFLHRPFPINLGTPDIPLIRKAAVTPWDSAVYFIPEKPPARTSRPSAIPADRTQEGLFVLVGSGGSCCATAANIERGGSLQSEGAGRSFAGGSTETKLVIVVPDGVARVVFVLPRQPERGSPGAPIYPRSLEVGVPVRGNVAAVRVRRECCSGPVPMIWYAADGHPIKRIGDFKAANHVVAPPEPASETPQSRAGERDPSTPNPVWVTPPTGGPHAQFRVHFRVLLTDATYTYTLSGTRCPHHTPPGGSGGGRNDIRGRIWSDGLTAVQGQAWCPGTYHVSVSVSDLGRNGPLKRATRPFGTATFTVHR
jgi:hypothetical protein